MRISGHLSSPGPLAPTTVIQEQVKLMAAVVLETMLPVCAVKVLCLTLQVGRRRTLEHGAQQVAQKAFYSPRPKIRTFEG